MGQPPPGIPTVGSALHGTGMCKPCAWFWKSSGCTNQGDCLHCHLCPQSELKARKKAKITMMRLGLATPKSMATSADVSEQDTSNFSGFICRTALPHEVVMLDDFKRPEDLDMEFDLISSWGKNSSIASFLHIQARPIQPQVYHWHFEPYGQFFEMNGLVGKIKSHNAGCA